MDKKEIQSRVNKTISDQLMIKEDEFTAESKFKEDLGSDSLDAVELAMAIEEEFDIKIEYSEIESTQTVQELYDLVDSEV